MTATTEEPNAGVDSKHRAAEGRRTFGVRRIADLARVGLVPVMLVCITTPDAVLHQKLFKLSMVASNIVHQYVGR